jgi:hypothetical protein
LRDLFVHVAVHGHEKAILEIDTCDRHALAGHDAPLHVRIDGLEFDGVPVE